MRSIFFLCLVPFLQWTPEVKGQETFYPVSQIDPMLLKDAAKVIRINDWKIDINSLNSETITIHKVITILKGSAIDDATCKVFYNEWSDVNRFEGAVYDAGGRLIRKLGRKDITDRSAIEDGTLYSNERVQYIKPVVAVSQFTVEYFIRESIRGMLVYPAWSPQDDFHTSVESASLEINADEGLFPRYKAMKIPADAMVSGDGRQTMSWKLSHLEAVVEEPFCPSLGELVPKIYLEPNAYSASGYTGNFSSWRTYGKWIASLQESRDSLGVEMHQKVKALIEGAENTTEKVRRIYKYMQSTCRYVCVVVGLGGVQAEKASRVARLGYGDCKGLVNYTAALLKIAGIPSFYTLVRAGENEEAIQQDFPGDQFNHIILCVPVENDTLWLECTNQKKPFGFLGSFTSDRAVLMVTPNGGVLTRTPAYSGEQNLCSRLTQLTVDSSGSASGRIRCIYSGLQSEDKMELPYLSIPEQQESLQEYYNVPGTRYTGVSFVASGERLPFIEEKAEMEVPKFATITGPRMFISLNRFIEKPGIFPKDDSRKSDVIIPYPYIDSDTVVIEFPAGYKVENMPPPLELKSPFGLLRSEVKVEKCTITLYRHFELVRGRYPADNYNRLVDFLRQVARQDKTGVVVIR